MASYLGKLVTSVTTKFGLCSRKAAVRLASETGCKLVDESVRLGRNLTTQEIQTIFSKSLPKRLRPKIIMDKDVFAKEMVKRGMDTKSVSELVEHPQVFGAALTMGSKKAPMYVNIQNCEKLFGKYNFSNANSVYAHELEHAIERNNTFRGIFKRKICEPVERIFRKDFQGYVARINKESLEFQLGLQNTYSFDTAQRTNAIRNYLSQAIDGSAKKERLFKRILNLETPAYKTGAHVEKYGFDKNQVGYYMQQPVSEIYSEAQKMLRLKQV